MNGCERPELLECSQSKEKGIDTSLLGLCGVATYFLLQKKEKRKKKKEKKTMMHNLHIWNSSSFINWIYKYNLVEYHYKALVLNTIYVKQ